MLFGIKKYRVKHPNDEPDANMLKKEPKNKNTADCHHLCCHLSVYHAYVYHNRRKGNCLALALIVAAFAMIPTGCILLSVVHGNKKNPPEILAKSG